MHCRLLYSRRRKRHCVRDCTLLRPAAQGRVYGCVVGMKESFGFVQPFTSLPGLERGAQLFFHYSHLLTADDGTFNEGSEMSFGTRPRWDA